MNGLEVTDESLVNKIQLERCNDSFKEISNRHGGICLRVCQKYSQALAERGMNIQDIYDDKEYIIYKACLLYKKGKEMKVSSWIGSYARYYCLSKLDCKSVFVPLEENWTKQVIEPQDYTLDYIFTVLASLNDDRINKIFKMRYSLSHKKKISWNEIGSTLGLSSQMVINLHKKGLKLLKRKLNSKEIFDNI
jgi:hypothetical protein